MGCYDVVSGEEYGGEGKEREYGGERWGVEVMVVSRRCVSCCHCHKTVHQHGKNKVCRRSVRRSVVVME